MVEYTMENSVYSKHNCSKSDRSNTTQSFNWNRKFNSTYSKPVIVSSDLQPLRNLQLDRSRIKDHLDILTRSKIKVNEKRSDTKIFQIGDFILMHGDDRMHQGKLKYEFQGPYEIVGITSEDRYEIKRVGKYLVTNCKAAKEQLRISLSDWSMLIDMEGLLEILENEEADSETK